MRASTHPAPSAPGITIEVDAATALGLVMIHSGVREVVELRVLNFCRPCKGCRSPASCGTTSTRWARRSVPVDGAESGTTHITEGTLTLGPATALELKERR